MAGNPVAYPDPLALKFCFRVIKKKMVKRVKRRSQVGAGSIHRSLELLLKTKSEDLNRRQINGSVFICPSVTRLVTNAIVRSSKISAVHSISYLRCRQVIE